MRLNLGAGHERIAGFTSVDIDESANPQIVANADWLPMIDTEGVDEIRAVDVLEHLPYRLVHQALVEWNRVLKPAGRLYVQVPDFAAVVEMYLGWHLGRSHRLVERLPGDLPQTAMGGVNWRLMGGQDGTYGDPRFNTHLTLFDRTSLLQHLDDAGFEADRIETNEHPNLQVWAYKAV